jgi:hypothetical protein
MCTNPSICIPRIESDINRQNINNIFKNFGTVDRIDIVNSGRRARKAFIHFKRWNHTDLLSRLENGDTVNLIYNFPWYWKCRKSNLPKPYYSSN